MLRHYQKLAIGAVEKPIAHRSIGDIHGDAAAGMSLRRTVSCDRQQALDEIGGNVRQGRRVPAQLIGRKGLRVGLVGKGIAVERLERRVRHRRTNSIEPGSPIGVPRRRECSSRELLRVEIIGTTLR